ncbi:IS66 family insertion sequence element accessory protein TnpB [Mesorhizobium sp. M1338]|uniref:IS66 family insertion sequence element accessory protein TnpB n=1 Tax=Mesorhizobium sp. M1338 TaxID=2957085 RepID=UPI00333A8978
MSSNRNAPTGFKILVWDRTGMVLIHKRLEGAKFVWPQKCSATYVERPRGQALFQTFHPAG